MSFQCATLPKWSVCALNAGIIARQCITLMRERDLNCQLFPGLTGTPDLYWKSVHCLPNVNLPRTTAIDFSTSMHPDNSQANEDSP